MKIGRLSDGKLFLNGLEKPEIRGFSSENSIENLGQEKVSSLKNAINELKRLIEQGGVELDGVRLTDPSAPITQSGTLKFGKRTYRKIQII